MLAIGLVFFGISWAIDHFVSTSALLVFSGAMLVAPIIGLEVARQVRRA